MKFIHCADLHLDSKIDTLPSDKSKIRRGEIIRTFEKLCDYASNNGVKAVILAGDVFDSNKITAKTKERFFSAIERNNGVDFLYLFGNHDADSDILKEEKFPGNLKFFGHEWTYFRYEDTVIAGVSFDSVNDNFVYDTLKLNSDDKNIVVLHGQGKNYNSADSTQSINFPRLKNKGIDYLALGHIHTFEEDKIDNRCSYVYVGCLDGRGFDELYDKGFMLIDTEDKLTYKFIKFCSRVYHEAEFDLTDKENFAKAENEIIRVLKDKFNKDDLVKVILKGDISPDFNLDKNTLCNLLNEYFFFAKVYDKTKLKISLSDYEFDKSIKGEFVRTVLLSDLTTEQKDKVLLYGLKALKGEDLQ